MAIVAMAGLAASEAVNADTDGRHSEAPRFRQRGEESQTEWSQGKWGPWLRLKSGFAQDDAVGRDLRLNVERDDF